MNHAEIRFDEAGIFFPVASAIGSLASGFYDFQDSLVSRLDHGLFDLGHCALKIVEGITLL